MLVDAAGRWWMLMDGGGCCWMLVGRCTWEDGLEPTNREAGFEFIKRCLQIGLSSAQQEGQREESPEAGEPKQIILF